MEKLLKKYKIYLSCLGILFIIGIGFVFYSSSQEKKIMEQKQNIEKYVGSMVDSENGINDKLNNVKNGAMVTIGDSNYIAEQLKNIQDNFACLYSYQSNKIEYLDEYTKTQTDYNTYQEYYNYLNSKYDLNDYNNYNKTAEKLIDSVSNN